MKEETKELIEKIKYLINSLYNGNPVFIKTASNERDRMITLLDSILGYEKVLTKGGVIQDCKGNLCKDGDWVKVALFNYPVLQLKWNFEDRCFHLLNKDKSHRMILFDEKIEKVCDNIIVIASGGFDPLHSGHIEYLNKAAQLGNKLYVIINKDDFLIKKKGYRLLDQKTRAEIVGSLKCVDKVVFSVDNDMSVCKTIAGIADRNKGCKLIFAKGGDRNSGNIPEKEICDKLGIEIVDGLGEKIASSSEIVKAVIRQ